MTRVDDETLAQMVKHPSKYPAGALRPALEELQLARGRLRELDEIARVVEHVLATSDLLPPGGRVTAEKTLAPARQCIHQGCETRGPDHWMRKHEADPHTECPECGRTFSLHGLPGHRRSEHGIGAPIDPLGDNRGRPDRRYRRVRSLGQQLEELDEQERLIGILRANLAHAYDVAFAPGSSGGGRTDIAYSDSTGNTAGDQRLQYSREMLGDASAYIGAVTRGLSLAVTSVKRSVPGSDPYEQARRPGAKDSPVTPHEQAIAEDKVRDRSRKGEL